MNKELLDELIDIISHLNESIARKKPLSVKYKKDVIVPVLSTIAYNMSASLK